LRAVAGGPEGVDKLDEAHYGLIDVGARDLRAASTMDIRNTSRMEQHRRFSSDEARDIGVRIGIDWTSSRFDVEQFRMGLGVELEHGRHDPATNVTDDDELTTGKIAWAHLNEFPDYYTRLAKMEAEAEQYWAGSGAS
jgi:hypothetical protein